MIERVRDRDLGGGWSYSTFVIGNEVAGAIIDGPATENCIYPQSGGRCGGSVHFTGSASTAGAKWKVEQDEPLTLSPSIQCACKGQHGHIVNGIYVPC